MRILKNLTTTMLLALALVLLVQGCSTMRGAGQDIEKAGEAVQRAAH
jgi:predicted small secreted protein